MKKPAFAGCFVPVVGFSRANGREGSNNYMQKTISLKQVSVDFGTKTVLDQVSTRFSVPDRISIVGENGEGKSTLLKIIAGTLEPSEGVVHKSNGTRVHYVPQEFLHEHMELTVHAYVTSVAGHQVYQKVESYARDMGFSIPRHKDSLCSSLSGGQQKIIALSVGVALHPDFLLLDEPENHLDIVTRKKLLDILLAFPGALLCISHDRHVIDALAHSVLEVANGKLFISEGGYDDYRAARLRRIEGSQRTFDAEEKRITQLKKAFVIAKQKAYRGKEAAAYHRIKEELGDLKQSHKEEKRAKDEFTKIKLATSSSDLHTSKLLLKVENLTYSYPGKKQLFKKLTFDVRVGNHVVLLGRNGSVEGTDGVVEPVNYNSPGQLVIAGTAEGVKAVGPALVELGCKVIALPVSAPFHSRLMRPAEERLTPHLASEPFGDAAVPVYVNVDASPRTRGSELRDALMRQVSRPVRWQESVARMAEDGVTLCVEVGPGKVLTGLAKRIDKTLRCVSVQSPADFDGARAAILEARG